MEKSIGDIIQDQKFQSSYRCAQISSSNDFYSNNNQMSKLVQYKSIEYPSTKQSQKYIQQSRQIRTSAGSINNVNHDLNRNQLMTSQRKEETSGRQIKTQLSQNVYQDQSYYDIPQYSNLKTNIIRRQKHHLKTFSNEFIPFQVNKNNISTDSLKNNHLNSTSGSIKSVHTPLSFKLSLQNSYVSIEDPDDVALAKKIERIMCSRSSPKKSIIHEQSFSKNDRIEILKRKNTQNQELNDQFKLTEQTKLEQQSQIVSPDQPICTNQSYGKQNLYIFDRFTHTNKQGMFNYLKRKILKNEQTIDNKQNKQQKYYHSQKQNYSNDRYAADVNQSNNHQKNYISTSPNMTLTSLRENRTFLSQSQEKRQKQKQSFYEKFSQKLKDNKYIVENQQLLESLLMYQPNIQDKAEYLNYQQNIQQYNANKILQMNFYPMPRRRILSLLDNQLNSSYCEKMVANFVNKSINGDIGQELKQQDEKKVVKKLNLSQNTIHKKTNNEISSSLKTQQKQNQQDDNIQNDNNSIRNSFFLNDKLQAESKKYLESIPNHKNSTSQMNNLKHSNSKGIQEIEDKQENKSPLINSYVSLKYSKSKNQTSIGQDDPDLRQYLIENKYIPINKEMEQIIN